MLRKAFEYRGLPDSGLYYSNLAYQLSNELKYPDGQKLSKIFAGLVFFNNHQIDTARVLLLEPYEFDEPFPFEEGVLFWLIGSLHTQNSSFKEADLYFEKAIKKFVESDSLLFKAKAINSHGNAYFMRSQLPEALALYIDSYEIKMSLKLEKETANELSNIGLVYRRMGMYKKAMEYYRKSLAIGGSTKLNRERGFGYIGIGDVFFDQQILDSALYYYEVALSNMSPNFKNGNAYVNLNVGSIYLSFGELNKALEYCKRSQEFSQGENFAYKAEVLWTLGLIYLSQNKQDSAKAHFTKGLKLADQLQHTALISSLQERLAHYYAGQSVYDSAYYYLNLRKTRQDSIYGHERKLFTEQYKRFETIKHQNQIDLLTEQNKLILYKRKTQVISSITVIFLLLVSFIIYRKKQLSRQKLLSVQNEKLETELEKNKALLSSHTLSMIHRKNGLEEIETHLVDINGNGKQKIKTIININKALEKDWDNFSNYFSQVHSKFFEVLDQNFEDLSQNDFRLCALIKMNLANKEIASLLNIETKSVKMARYRLKKKLGINEDTRLNNFIHELV